MEKGKKIMGVYYQVARRLKEVLDLLNSMVPGIPFQGLICLISEKSLFYKKGDFFSVNLVDINGSK